MTTIAQQVSRAIRILRGNRDESARASHLVASKEQFAYNELLLVGQAEREKFFQSTFFERKIMKTAFKRVALVAAAALAIGGISAVSANASGVSDWTISNAYAVGGSGNAETATQIAGPANYVTLTAIPGTVVWPHVYGGIYFTVTGGTTTTGTTSGTVLASGSVNIATPAAGTITVTSYQITDGAAATTATTTTTITVLAALAGTVYASSTVLANAAVGSPSPTTNTNYAAVTAPANGTQVAQFSVAELDPNGVPVYGATYGKNITATVTNGLISSDISGGFTGNTTYVSGTPVAAVTNFILSSVNGLAGTATLTLSVNGVVVQTYTATFTGSAVKIVLTAVNPVIALGTVSGVTANTDALEVQEFDANGNAIASNANTITVTPASSAIATAGSLDYNTAHTLGNITGGTALSNSVAGVTLTGAAVGTTTFTATDSSNTLTSAPVSVRVSSAVPTSVVFATDAAAYASGGAGTLTATLSDAAGTVPAGQYAVLTSAGANSSYALTVGSGSLPGVSTTAPAVAGSIIVNDSGVFTSAFNAPISDATGVTISATPAATTITVTPATFDVTSGASDAANAATDAANEATDAANAATDAANAAADSADAATQAAQDAGDKADAALAAVTALSQQVTTLLAKVASLAATLAKITKAIAALPKK